MRYWTDQLRRGDVIELDGYRRKVRSVKRQGDHVHSVVVAKRGNSQYDSPTTRISAAKLRHESGFGIVDTGVDLEETYLEEQIQRLVDGESIRPPMQDDLTPDDPIY